MKNNKTHFLYVLFNKKEASTVICSVVKHAGSGRAQEKCRGKHKTLSSVSPYFFICFVIKNPIISLRIWLNFYAKRNFPNKEKWRSAILGSLIKHVKMSQSQSLLQLFKKCDWLTI